MVIIMMGHFFFKLIPPAEIHPNIYRMKSVNLIRANLHMNRVKVLVPAIK